jgi:hypothetical protein
MRSVVLSMLPPLGVGSTDCGLLCGTHPVSVCPPGALDPQHPHLPREDDPSSLSGTAY